MKNHKRVDGQLLQTNKKWSALKQSQRAWIAEITRDAHTAYCETQGTRPIKKNKAAVLGAVHNQMIQRNIWIPYHEFEQHVGRHIDRLNRKRLAD